MQLVLKTILENGEIADKDVFDFDDDSLQKDLDYVEWPKDYLHKMLFNPSFKIRAKAVEQEPTDIAITEKYISEETCRSNLFELASREIFPSLSASAQAEVFNKCPEAVHQTYYLWTDDDAGRALVKEISALVKDPYARGCLEFKITKVPEEDSYYDFAEKLLGASYNGKPFSIGVRDAITLLESHWHGDSLEKQRVIEAMLDNPIPEIREAVSKLVTYSGHVKKLAKDPCFSIRLKVIKNNKFEDTDFSVEELLEVISEDPEVAKEVLAHCEYFVGNHLCEKLAESNVLEIRSMALERLSAKPLHGIEDGPDADDEEEEVEDEDSIDEDFDQFAE